MNVEFVFVRDCFWQRSIWWSSFRIVHSTVGLWC